MLQAFEGREEDLPTAAHALGIYGAFMLPFLNAAELLTIP